MDGHVKVYSGGVSIFSFNLNILCHTVGLISYKVARLQ